MVEKKNKMKIRFWGVRGSIPTPLSSSQIEKKLISLINKIFENYPSTLPFEQKPNDKDIQNFLETLPVSLKGTYGGETTCVEVQVPDSPLIMIDAGSGARMLGQEILSRLFSSGKVNPLNTKEDFHKSIHLFFSHYHWDHLQGFPFFTPAFVPGKNRLNIHFYGKEDNSTHINEILSGQQQYPNFPVEWEALPCEKITHQLPRLDPTPISIGNAIIDYRELSHPDFVFSYKVQCKDKSFVFATDYEHRDQTDPRLISLARNADILYYDCQYTPEEYAGKPGNLTGSMPKFDWGHSTYEWAVKHGLEANVKHLILGHHEPLRDDFGIEDVLKKAREYARKLSVGYPDSKMTIESAVEGQEIIL